MTVSRLVAYSFIKNKGTANIYNLSFANGTSGEYFSPGGEPSFGVGDELEFKTVPSQFEGRAQHIKINTMDRNSNGNSKPSGNEAHISAIALCKSALEGRLIEPSEVKELYEDYYHFFVNFIPRAEAKIHFHD